MVSLNAQKKICGKWLEEHGPDTANTVILVFVLSLCQSQGTKTEMSGIMVHDSHISGFTWHEKPIWQKELWMQKLLMRDVVTLYKRANNL